MRVLRPLQSAFSLLILGSLVSSGCTIGTLSLEQVQATAHDLAATGIVLTLTAMPTNTQPSTATPLPTNTATLEPSLTPSEAASSTPTFPPAPLATVTPYGQFEGADFDQAKDDKTDQNAPLALVNASSEDSVKFALLTPYYNEYEFTSGMSLIVSEGEYSYRVWVGNKIMNGSFRITNGDKHVVTIRDDRVNFAAP